MDLMVSKEMARRLFGTGIEVRWLVVAAGFGHRHPGEGLAMLSACSLVVSHVLCC
jgi:hypothetical protein